MSYMVQRFEELRDGIGYDEDGERIRIWINGVEAWNDYGMCYRYYAESLEHAKNLEVVFHVQAFRDELDPANAKGWQFERYCYGSQAFLDNYNDATYSMMDGEELDYHRQRGTVFTV